MPRIRIGQAGIAVREAGGLGAPVVLLHGSASSSGQWRALAERLEAAGTRFVVEPHIRFEGQPGEQATMFFLDPSGNAIEIKAMRDPAKLFAKN